MPLRKQLIKNESEVEDFKQYLRDQGATIIMVWVSDNGTEITFDISRAGNELQHEYNGVQKLDGVIINDNK